MKKSTQALANDIKKRKEKTSPQGSEYYNLRPIMGNANRAIFYFLLGGR